MIKWFAKKFILGKLNELLGNLLDNEKVEYWRLKIIKYIKFLNNLMMYLEDNKISDEEAEKVIDECQELFK